MEFVDLEGEWTMNSDHSPNMPVGRIAFGPRPGFGPITAPGNEQAVIAKLHAENAHWRKEYERVWQEVYEARKWYIAEYCKPEDMYGDGTDIVFPWNHQ